MAKRKRNALQTDRGGRHSSQLKQVKFHSNRTDRISCFAVQLLILYETVSQTQWARDVRKPLFKALFNWNEVIQ